MVPLAHIDYSLFTDAFFFLVLFFDDFKSILTIYQVSQKSITVW